MLEIDSTNKAIKYIYYIYPSQVACAVSFIRSLKRKEQSPDSSKPDVTAVETNRI